MSHFPSSPTISLLEQQNLIEKHQVLKIQGRDKHGHNVLHIVGKFFPSRLVSSKALNNFLAERIFVELGEKPFSVVYFHTGVQRNENFPGISLLRTIYEAFPVNAKDHLEALYFVHPGIQARLFLAAFGRLLFSSGLYKKLKYVNRLEFLWDHVRRNEMEIPEYVYDHDEELEYRPIMDYGIESDHLRVYGEPLEYYYPVSMYSMRCIA